MGRGRRCDLGFSLVEVLAVSVLLTLLLAVIYPLAQIGWRNWYHTDVETELRDAVNLVMGAVGKDLLRAAWKPGHDAVEISDQRLVVVTDWSEPSASNVVPEQFIVYTIQFDALTGKTHIYRYVGPPSEAGRGMRLAGEDVDFPVLPFKRKTRAGCWSNCKCKNDNKVCTPPLRIDTDSVFCRRRESDAPWAGDMKTGMRWWPYCFSCCSGRYSAWGCWA